MRRSTIRELLGADEIDLVQQHDVGEGDLLLGLGRIVEALQEVHAHRRP